MKNDFRRKLFLLKRFLFNSINFETSLLILSRLSVQKSIESLKDGFSKHSVKKILSISGFIYLSKLVSFENLLSQLINIRE